MALTGAIFGQTWSPSAFGYIQTYPQYELMSHEPQQKERVEALRNGDITNPVYKTAVEYFSVSAYSFFLNKKLYMLSYDTCSTCGNLNFKVGKPIQRGLFLFRLDKDSWTKVSDALQTDYYSLDSSIDEPSIPQHNIWSSDCYLPVKNITGDYNNDKSLKNGSVTIEANGNVTIVLVNRKMYHDSNVDIKQSLYNKTVVLVPNNDGTYKVQ